MVVIPVGRTEWGRGDVGSCGLPTSAGKSLGIVRRLLWFLQSSGVSWCTNSRVLPPATSAFERRAQSASSGVEGPPALDGYLPLSFVGGMSFAVSHW